MNRAEIQKIVAGQLQEKERKLAQKCVPREVYAKYAPHIDNALVKAIIGPRRAGKSTFAFELLRDRHFAYVNFDDEKLAGVTDYDELLSVLVEIYGKFEILFLDEVQNLGRWELLVNRLQRQGYNLVVSGSNAQLLSGELATHLTGRHVTLPVLPFSFREFLNARGDVPAKPIPSPAAHGNLLNRLREYLDIGGYPEVVVHDIEAKTYLKTLYEGILFKDVVRRFNVRYPRLLGDLGGYLVTQHAGEITFNALKKALGHSSTATVQKYVDYLTRVYVVFFAQRYSPKLKIQLKAPQKVYGYDTGMVGAVKFGTSTDHGRYVENAVAIELIRTGKEFYTYKTADQKEVDFVVREGLEIRQLIQVCYDLSQSKTRRRELGALRKASQELRCKNLLIVSWDEEGREKIDGLEVTITPLWRFLRNGDRYE